MNKQDFIGRVVISAKTKNKFVLTKIHAAYINIGCGELNRYGTRLSYSYEVDCEDPFTRGDLYFEDAALTERFKKEYNEYCRSEEGRSEAWMYWM
jgi:hypothetical protein